MRPAPLFTRRLFVTFCDVLVRIDGRWFCAMGDPIRRMFGRGGRRHRARRRRHTG